MIHDLKWLVVGETNDVRLRLEKRLINFNLTVRVDRVVSDVEVLDNARFGELISDAAARFLVLDQLTRQLLNGEKNGVINYF